MTSLRIYLDHNATSPLREESKEAVAAALELAGNPSSVHSFGREARRTVAVAREAVAALVGASPAEVVFTSGATEANNLALGAIAGRRLLTSAIEHPSVLEAAGAERLPVDEQGLVDLTVLQAQLERCEGQAFVSVMLANNETGVVQPIAEISALIRAAGGLLHCDAVQAVGRLPVDMAGLGVDYLSLSSHKLGGPKGAGALIVREGAPLVAQQLGGGQERRLRAGTENVPAIAGFGAACQAIDRGFVESEALRSWRDRFEDRLLAIAPETLIFGREAARLANTSCFANPFLPAETQLIALDLAGIAVSSGSACSSGKVSASHVLLAMGAEPALAGSALRVSLGWNSREADLDCFLEAWGRLYKANREQGRKALDNGFDRFRRASAGDLSR